MQKLLVAIKKKADTEIQKYLPFFSLSFPSCTLIQLLGSTATGIAQFNEPCRSQHSFKIGSLPHNSASTFQSRRSDPMRGRVRPSACPHKIISFLGLQGATLPCIRPCLIAVTKRVYEMICLLETRNTPPIKDSSKASTLLKLFQITHIINRYMWKASPHDGRLYKSVIYMFYDSHCLLVEKKGVFLSQECLVIEGMKD